jgi:hypothetical protein
MAKYTIVCMIIVNKYYVLHFLYMVEVSIWYGFIGLRRGSSVEKLSLDVIHCLVRKYIHFSG